MEELQLSLTTARVEQRNFGIWLKSWQVGQTLQALVTDKLPSGNMVLRIAGHQVTATADIPVQKGALLTLEVAGTNPQLLLKVVNVSGQPLVAPNPIQLQLRSLMPRQNAVAEPLVAMANLLKSANLLSQLIGGLPMLKQLEKHLPQLSAFTKPSELRKAMEQSGIFLESQLQVAEGKPHGHRQMPDLKAQLFRLLAKLELALMQPDEQLAPAYRDDAQSLKRQLDGALANISLKQLGALEAAKQGNPCWSFELPFKLGESIQSVSLAIYQEPAESEDGETSETGWKVLLKTDFQPLGGIDASIKLRGTKLWLVFSAEREETVASLSQFSSQLEEALTRGGFEVAVLRYSRNKTESLPVEGVSGAGLDERV